MRTKTEGGEAPRPGRRKQKVVELMGKSGAEGKIQRGWREVWRGGAERVAEPRREVRGG